MTGKKTKYRKWMWAVPVVLLMFFLGFGENSDDTGQVDQALEEPDHNPVKVEEVETVGKREPFVSEKDPQQEEHSQKAKMVFQEVPFTSQAPFGEWSDRRQQDGCEEASVLMAMRWVTGGGLTRQEAKEEILAISDYQQEEFGSFVDTSARDTGKRILEGYYDFHDYELVASSSPERIIDELLAGNLVIAPMNGRLLGNPNFTGEGPERHMVLLKGYDPEKEEFISNDPGTRKGESYRYGKDIFYQAIRDYPTGNHLPLEDLGKNVIIIKK